MGAAIATWFRLRLPFCGPGSEFQAHHLRFFQFVLLKLLLELEKNEKRPGLAHIFLKKLPLLPPSLYIVGPGRRKRT